MSTVLVGSCSNQATDLDAAFARNRVKTNEVDDELLEDGQIVSGVAGSGAHLIVGKDDIHAPMETVLDRPVLTNHPGSAFSVRGQAAEVIAGFKRCFSLDRPFRLDDHKGHEVRPLRRVVQAVELIEDETAAMLDPTVILFDRLEEPVRGFVRRGGLEQGEEVAHRVGQLGLVVLG